MHSGGVTLPPSAAPRISTSDPSMPSHLLHPPTPTRLEPHLVVPDVFQGQVDTVGQPWPGPAGHFLAAAWIGFHPRPENRFQRVGLPIGASGAREFAGNGLHELVRAERVRDGGHAPDRVLGGWMLNPDQRQRHLNTIY